MAVDVLTEITIERPVDVVASYAADPANAPEWYENIESAVARSEPPVAVGSHVDFTARFLRRRLVYTYEITALVPEELLTMRTAEGPFPMETTYTWAATAAGVTRMSLRNRGEPTGFSRVLAPVMSGAIRRANRKDLARLKAILESR